MKRFFETQKLNKKLRDIHGYTMAEVLMVVAIMGILAAVSFVGVFAMKRNMTQTQADKNAELIFEAAQRQLVSFEAFDQDAVMYFAAKDNSNGIETPVGLSGVTPTDFNMLAQNPDAPENTSSLQYLLLKGQISDDLFADGWIVEYDNTSLQVKSVFYFPEEDYHNFYYDEATNQSLRLDRLGRLTYLQNNGKVIGYYDGKTSSVKTNELSVYSSLRVDNYEELVVKAGISARGKEAANPKYKIIVTTTGKTSGAMVTQVFTFKGSELNQNILTKSRTAEVSIVLDSLTGNTDTTQNKRFKKTYGSLTTNHGAFLTNNAPNTGFLTTDVISSETWATIDPEKTYDSVNFIPGEDLEIKVETQTEDGSVKDNRVIKEQVNSLYASYDETEALKGTYLANVAYGRHLQNLDEKSGINLSSFATAANPISLTDMKAIQTKDIYFDREENIPGEEQRIDAQWWKKVYGAGKKFLPITNEKLISYSVDSKTVVENGKDVEKYFVIQDPLFDTTQKSYAGLFAEFRGDKIDHVTLINPMLTGSSKTKTNGAMGGLVGKVAQKANANVSDTLTIEACQLYMDEDTAKKGMNSARDYWMNGATTLGGLVGYSNRSLEIKSSSASTVMNDATNAGGLVGVCEKNVKLSKSYADCYMDIRIKNIGGLIASCASSDTLPTVIDTCYSAGFVKNLDETKKRSEDGNIAGLAPVEVKTVKNSYSVFSFGEKEDYKKADTTYPTLNFYPTVKPTFNTAGTNVTDSTYVYYLTPNFDITQKNKVGSSRSSANMKLASYTGFSDGTFAYADDTTYGRVSVPYKLVAQTPELISYRYPMIIMGENKTLNHYGDWQDVIRVLNVRFLYSPEALQQKNAGKLTLPDTLHTTSDEFTKFEEDTQAPSEQKIQEESNAFLPKQNYELSGREKTILYWQFTYNGEDFFYVPKSEDSYNPTDGGKKYKGAVYRVAACQENLTAGNVEPWNNVPAVDTTDWVLPFEKVTQGFDMFARFYVADTVQYIRLHYRIFEDSNRNLTTALSRYIGKADVIKTDKEVNGQVVGTVYTAEAEAHANIGGYHFYGWATTETGKDSNGSSTMLTTAVANESSQKLLLTMDAVESGDLYAIYERIGYYPVNVEFCLYAGTDGWGANIAQPRYNIYSTEDWIGDQPDERKILLPKSGDVSGYELYKDASWSTYKALFFDASGNRNPSKDVEILYEGTSLSAALTAGTAYVNIDITKGGTYVVPYRGEGTVNYRVDKVYIDTDANGVYSLGAERTVTGEVKPNAVRGSNIDPDELKPEDTGFEFDHFGTNATSQISASTPENGTYVCKIYYKRKSYELFYDLNHGTYLDGTVKKGYREDEVLAYGQPLNTATFVATTTADPNLLTLDGWTFAGWKYYLYSNRSSEHTASTMPKERLIAVAQWAVSANTPVRLEVYRQDRTNTLSGTFNNLYVANGDKTYSLQKTVDISGVISGAGGRNELLNVGSYASLMTVMDRYKNSIATLPNGDVFAGDETKYYFNAADTVSNDSKIKWADIKPTIDANGDIVVRLYYDRRIITTKLYYANYSNQSYVTRDVNKANTNSGTQKITSGNYNYGYGYNNGKYISMKALYGANFDDSIYVWTDELYFIMGSGNHVMGKRHLNTFADEDMGIGEYMSGDKTTWEFNVYSANDTSYTYYAYFESLGTTNPKTKGSETLYFEDSPKYTYYTNGGTNNIFGGGANYGYTLWAKQLNDGTVSDAVDGGSYPMSEANKFYFKRVDNLSVQFDALSTVSYAASYTNLKFGQTVPLPTSAQVTRARDNGEYTFGGWYPTSACADGTQITEITMDNHAAQVYAKWIPKNKTITYIPAFKDGVAASASFVNTKEVGFGTTVGDLKVFASSDAGTITINGLEVPKIYEEAGNIYYRFYDGEGHLNKYRFDGWWRTDTSGNFTVQMTGNEILYANATVTAKWTQTSGYATLKIHCVQVDHTDTVNWYNQDYAQKIPLDTDTYVMAPLVDAATWNVATGVDWAGYYPTQTRIMDKFFGDNPEVTFYYSKGSVLTYTVTYKVTFSPYAGTTGTAETVAVKEQTYSVTGDSASVVPQDINGCILTSTNATATVTKDANEAVFDYAPDLRTVKMTAKTVYGTDESVTESFPLIEMKELEAIFQTYAGATSEYTLAPMYQIFDAEGNSVTNNSYVTYDAMKDTIEQLPSGTYRALGQIRLKKNGTDLLTIWQSSSYVGFTLSGSAN